ncbi:hypothetical protein BCR34DRAFT_595289 [Clohesyomyces aquaticus]|uniref:F-box domain-containing protein n=1 Tax=Clohesyomyces aquaticus TaxID=1231657 RepID=A0A1Y2ABB2_9PLEO|nr:hypothetical protein BCR34DRAFT_595289 [Clohesyomyces aquaticus]
MASLETVPTGQACEIMGYLRPGHLTRLARVSKQLNFLAQSLIWRNVELHRKRAHLDDVMFTTTQPAPPSSNIYTGHWCYNGELLDPEYNRRNPMFNTTVARTIELIGISTGPSVDDGPPWFTWRQPVHIAFQVNSICNIRLRGYIPSGFASALCQHSSTSLVTLELGLLQRPRNLTSDGEIYEEYAPPRWPLLFSVILVPNFSSLTHLHLCKRGSVHKPFGLEDFISGDIFEDDDCLTAELYEWVSLLLRFRSTLVELILELRPVVDENILTYFYDDPVMYGDDVVDHRRAKPDTQFFFHVIKIAFDDGAE